VKNLCVFCGSSPGAQPDYLRAAEKLGVELVKRGIGLVYGGASVGLMGKVATTVLAGGGQVIGVMPEALVEKEVALNSLQDLRVVRSMHERKALMADLSDGFVGLPGGLGTAEEFFEVLTWAQLGIHQKPCGLLNICHYYDDLISFLDRAVDQEFIRPEHRSMVLVDDDPGSLLKQFETYQPPIIDKAEWIISLNAV
jgi:uncharacterized protein (TIGR00730 family)